MVTNVKQKPTSKSSFSQAQRAAALAAAPDSPVVDAENPPTQPTDWAGAVLSRSLPELREKLAKRHRGPSRAPLKVPTTIRFDPEVLAALKASGKGWQTRVNEAMREWVKSHSRT
ncbi:MAG: BrnA antitoxin family protein [Sulfuritalea sp.]|nr:BrnA antitoxin family protein [Sulfuritalea sp.]